jgi:hypothetical protein
MSARIAEHPALTLAAESRIADLLKPRADDALEASGVCLKDGAFYVIFDDSRFIAQLDRSLTVGHPRNTWIHLRKRTTGLEDVAYDEVDHRFLTVVEARKIRRRIQTTDRRVRRRFPTPPNPLAGR